MGSSILGLTGKLSWFLTILAGAMTLPVMFALQIFRLPAQPCPPACNNYGCVIATCIDTTGLYSPKSFWQIATITANFIPVYCMSIALVFSVAMLLMKGKAFFMVAGMACIATLAYLYAIITWIMQYNVVNANPRPAHEVTGILLLGCGGLLLLIAIGTTVFRRLTKR